MTYDGEWKPSLLEHGGWTTCQQVFDLVLAITLVLVLILVLLATEEIQVESVEHEACSMGCISQLERCSLSSRNDFQQQKPAIRCRRSRHQR